MLKTYHFSRSLYLVAHLGYEWEEIPILNIVDRKNQIH